MRKKYRIPFNKPFIIGKELYYIAQDILSGQLAGDGVFTQKCHQLLEGKFKAKKVLLTTSCTSALEMAAFLSQISPGDEVILPSFTFVSTANAFYLRGAKPIFVDIRPDTLNIDESKIEKAITKFTKIIIPVHYAGFPCEMDEIIRIAAKYDLMIVEDAAQAVNAKYKNRYLGTIGNLGAYSFHETKNFVCGEGGALVINDEILIERAEIIREKGTNRTKFLRGEIDKYTWVDVGSSYLPSDILAAFLYAQLEKMDEIVLRRQKIFNYYYQSLSPLAEEGKLTLPGIPPHCESNYHFFYILLRDEFVRNALIEHLKSQGILAVSHYFPLHLSPLGRKLGYKEGDFPVTEDVYKRLLRLPFYYELKEEEQREIVAHIFKFFKREFER
jgi:dTDP-4-amino-4,6-dideoxygalactose transaminase